MSYGDIDLGMFSRPNQLMLARADISFEHEARAEQRQREAEAEARAERAQRHAMEYFHQHGEWESDTMARNATLAGLREEREARRARAERAEQRDAFYAGELARGRAPRSREEIFEIARLMP